MPQTGPEACHSAVNVFGEIAAERFSRRGILAGAAALPALSLAASADAAAGPAAVPAGFRSVPENLIDDVVVPPGYVWRRLISWGDPLFDGMEPAKPARGAPFDFTRAEQERRFGTHNDMIALFPREWSWPWPQSTQTRMILCNNHESVSPRMAAPGAPGRPPAPDAATCEAMYAAMGVTVAELSHNPDAGTWEVVKGPAGGGGINRRVTPFTEVLFDGPAAAHPWIRSAAAAFNAAEAPRAGPPVHREGVRCGTLQNCAGGYTPWGTYLTAEENFDNQFRTSRADAPALARAAGDPAWRVDQASYGYGDGWPHGGPDSYDVSVNPHGPSAYGWIVEIDPYDPDWIPRKRTALGRKQNECATTVLTADGRVAVYMGDDAAGEFVYKFVSAGRFDPSRRTANRDLLSTGTLYAARFEADGTGRWIALDLDAANAAPRPNGAAPFADAGDVMVRAREAARRLGATAMDRPEDVEAPKDAAFQGQGFALVMCTGNRDPALRDGNAANPRRTDPDGRISPNHTGHVVRIDEDGGDHGATRLRWDLFAVAGDPASASAPRALRDGSVANLSSWRDGRPTTSGDRFAMPDNVCFDARGYAWISTDGTPDSFPCNDGAYVVPMSGAGPRPVKRFLTVPIGAECAGPLVSPDQRTFFCGVQHPGAADAAGRSWRNEADGPYSRFPDQGWPRDSIIYVRRADGGIVGT